MDWKDYLEQPDSGLFEKIERRLRRRRLMRRAGVAATVAVVAAVAALALWPASAGNESDASQQVAMLQSPEGISRSDGFRPDKSAVSNENGEALKPATSNTPEAVMPDRKPRKDPSSLFRLRRIPLWMLLMPSHPLVPSRNPFLWRQMKPRSVSFRREKLT